MNSFESKISSRLKFLTQADLDVKLPGMLHARRLQRPPFSRRHLGSLKMSPVEQDWLVRAVPPIIGPWAVS